MSKQLALSGSQTNPALTAARFLLKPGRKYEEAVKTFAPYDRVQEKNDEARAAGAMLIAAGAAATGKNFHLCEQPAGGKCAGVYLDNAGCGGFMNSAPRNCR